MNLFCAGAESALHIPLLKAGGLRRGFFSAMNANVAQSSAVYQPMQVAHKAGTTVIVDSGAHSFFAATSTIGSATNHLSQRKLPAPDVYHASYVEWIKANYDAIDYYVELDIGAIVGQPKVYSWRDDLKRAGVFDKCILVYHPAVEPLPAFLKAALAAPARYVGLEGLRKGKSGMDYMAVIRECYTRGIRAHGFAMMKPRWVERVPFFSVDSASWLGGSMWSNLCYPKPSGQASFMRLHGKLRDNPKHKAMWAHLSGFVDLAAICSTDPSAARPERDRLGALAYSRYEDWLRHYWEAKGVHWDDQVNRHRPKQTRRVSQKIPALPGTKKSPRLQRRG